MGTLECGAMVMRGYFDVFDRAIGAIEGVEKILGNEYPTQLHVPTAMNPDMPVHTFSPSAEQQARLDRAKEMVREACDITQNVLAEI